MIAILSSCSAFAQNSSPSMMILPDYTWCKKNGYVIEDRISKQEAPDYPRAFQENAELKKILTSIYSVYSTRGITFYNSEVLLNQYLNSLKDRASNTDSLSVELNENPLENFLNQADILIYLNYYFTVNGPKNSFSFILSGFDVCTGKQVINVISSSSPSLSIEKGLLIDQAVTRNAEDFDSQLHRYCDDMLRNGRSTVITFRISKSSSLNFNKMYNNKELGEIIRSWVQENSLNGSLINKVESKTMNFTDVRIPIIDTITKNSIKASTFIRPLQKILETAPYNISVKKQSIRSGKVILYLSEKL
jgi:hypothetical protein